MWFHLPLDGSREVLHGWIDILCVQALELNNRHTLCIRTHAFALLSTLYFWTEVYALNKEACMLSKQGALKNRSLWSWFWWGLWQLLSNFWSSKVTNYLPTQQILKLKTFHLHCMQEHWKCDSKSEGLWSYWTFKSSDVANIYFTLSIHDHLHCVWN